MVIAKIHQNSSARATLKYVLSKSGASVIGGNAADWVERDPLTQAQLATHIDTATAQLQQAIALKSLARPLYHISLSLPPQEALDDEPLCAFAEQYLAGLILSAEQPDLLKQLSEPEFQAALERFRDEELYKYCYTLVRHTDQPHPHVHLVIAKTNLETEKTMPTSHDRYRSQIVLRYLERQHGLAVQSHSWAVGQKAESTQQAQTTLKTGQPSVHRQLQTILEQAAAKSQTVPEFIAQVQAAGVEVRVSFTRTGKSKGISYSWQGVALAGNALGTRYSFKQGEPGLVKNLGLSYEPARDRPLIQALCQRPPETPKTALQEAAFPPTLGLEVAQQRQQWLAWQLQVDETVEPHETGGQALVLSDQEVPVYDQAAPPSPLLTPAASVSLETALIPPLEVTSDAGKLSGAEETAAKPPQALSQPLPLDRLSMPAPTPPVRQPQAERREGAKAAPFSAPTELEQVTTDRSEPALIEPPLSQPVTASVPAGEDEQADLEALKLRQQGEAQQRQVWGLEMVRVAVAALQYAKQTSYETQHYRFVQDGSRLTLTATDGRGILVIVDRQELWVNEQIMETDRNYFRSTGQKLAALQQPPPTKVRSQPAKDKKPGLER